MKQYLETLREKPDHHKRRFALVVSGLVTLFIFAVWSLVHVTLPNERLADQEGRVESAPVQVLWSSVIGALRGIGGDVKEIESVLEQVE